MAVEVSGSDEIAAIWGLLDLYSGKTDQRLSSMRKTKQLAAKNVLQKGAKIYYLKVVSH